MSCLIFYDILKFNDTEIHSSFRINGKKSTLKLICVLNTVQQSDDLLTENTT